MLLSSSLSSPIAIGYSIILLALLHSATVVFAVPALPNANAGGKSTNSNANNNKNNNQREFVVGHPMVMMDHQQQQQQFAAADPLQMGSAPPFLTSFSGYSYDYPPEMPSQQQKRSGKAWGFEASMSGTPPTMGPMAANPYDTAIGQPQQQQFRADAANANRHAGEDAFIIQPAPSEQFIPSPPSTMPKGQIGEEMAKFLPPANSQRPKLTGWVVGVHEPPVRVGEPFPGGQAVANPAAYYMQGADLTKVPPPRCELIGCQGPVPNDADFQLEQQEQQQYGGRTCHQTFVPLNGCLQGRGYSVGMICSICCECSAPLAREMHKSRGWLQGYRPQQQPQQ